MATSNILSFKPKASNQAKGVFCPHVINKRQNPRDDKIKSRFPNGIHFSQFKELTHA